MTGLSGVNSASNSRSERPCGCSGVGHQPEQVHDVDEPHLQFGKMLPQQRRRCQSLHRRNVAAARHHDVRFAIPVAARPLPDARTLGAVRYRGIHVEIRQMRLFVGDDHVDIVGATQAVIRDREQAIGIRRQVYTRHLRALVCHNIEKAGILMGEAVVVLAPYGGGDQQVERGDVCAPGNLPGFLQPFGSAG